MTADYDEVLKLTGKVTELLTKAKKAVIQKDGCTLTLNLMAVTACQPGVYGKPASAATCPPARLTLLPWRTASTVK